MIKVMHVCSDTNIGGAGRYLLNLLEETNREAFELIFVLPKGSKLTSMLEKYDGYVIEADIMPDQSFHKKDIMVMRKLMKEFKPDIVHTHASLSARIAAKLSGIKGLIYTRHYVDTSCMTEELNKKSSLKNQVKSFVNNTLCDGVIGVAKECEPILLEMGIKPEKIKIIPNGVAPMHTYLEKEKENVKTKYGIAKEHKVITVLARLSKEKGHEIFIDVIEELIKNGNKVIGVIAGTGIEAENIKKLIETKGLEKYIVMTGFVEDVEAILNITTVQMNTSYTEAQSLALSEGMSIGIPAVVTDAGGNPSMIRQGMNGYVAPIGDVKELANKVQMLLLDDVLYKNISETSKEIYKENYTASKMTRSTEAFYEMILKKNKIGR